MWCSFCGAGEEKATPWWVFKEAVGPALGCASSGQDCLGLSREQLLWGSRDQRSRSASEHWRSGPASEESSLTSWASSFDIQRVSPQE